MAKTHPPLFLLAPVEEKSRGLYPEGRQSVSPRRDSGIDLVAVADVEVPAHSVAKINLGLRAVCLRAGPEADSVAAPHPYWLIPRSSISKTPLMLANSLGLIDLGYRGPLIAAVRNLSAEDFTVRAGKALFQLAAADAAPPEYEVLEAADPRVEKYFGCGVTVRGDGGFGSTGEAGSAS